MGRRPGVDAGVDDSPTRAQEERQGHQHPEGRRGRVAQERQAGGEAARGEQAPQAEAGEEGPGAEARGHVAEGEGDEDRPLGVQRQPEGGPHGGPGGAEDAVGKAQADEGQRGERGEQDSWARHPGKEHYTRSRPLGRGYDSPQRHPRESDDETLAVGGQGSAGGASPGPGGLRGIGLHLAGGPGTGPARPHAGGDGAAPGDARRDRPPRRGLPGGRADRRGGLRHPPGGAAGPGLVGHDLSDAGGPVATHPPLHPADERHRRGPRPRRRAPRSPGRGGRPGLPLRDLGAGLGARSSGTSPPASPTGWRRHT